ncbi:hypothetical protein [Asanoa siamensis]|uniref:Uncharacterized protein n=1 Tax=Asanoa siamensis TaxID=926357 RepID=A0ABQ4CR28_9ACTN|nr:hypothetical protein [Asanoa siamensis]GIF73731.1 hypothetical protein Asi02nite_32490 [Asanoa siamensis]
MTGLATREEAFELIAAGVAAGIAAPWRLYLARGCRYVSLRVADTAEWDAWRIHLGCADLRIRVYDTGAEVRRSSVAEVVIDDCRVAVELLEEVGVDDIDHLLAGQPRIDRAPRYPDEP